MATLIFNNVVSETECDKMSGIIVSHNELGISTGFNTIPSVRYANVTDVVAGVFERKEISR